MPHPRTLSEGYTKWPYVTYKDKHLTGSLVHKQKPWHSLHLYLVWISDEYTLFTADNMACQSRKSTGVNNHINDDSIVSVLASHVSEWACRVPEPGAADLNGMLPSLMSLIPPVFFLLWQVNMSAVKTVYCTRCYMVYGVVPKERAVWWKGKHCEHIVNIEHNWTYIFFL